MVDAGRRLTALETSPTLAAAADLVGRVVGRGFRAAVDEVCEPGTLLSVLLSELPVAALLSGYGTLYTGAMPTPLPERVLARMPVDVCAGWATPATLMVRIGRDHEIPTPDGPVAPSDSAGWHDMPALEAGSMRRQRLIERAGDEVWAMFRDSYSRPDGVTTVLHEYSVTATLSDDVGVGDGGGDDVVGDGGARIVECVATPRVLPWIECPGAATTAGRLAGRPVAGLRGLVRDELVGTSTCTHLNDLLASLSQVDQLVRVSESPRMGRAR